MPIVISKHEGLTGRWYNLRPHLAQHHLCFDHIRFRIAAAGRRSGKTECAKRVGCRKAMRPQRYLPAYYIFAAPTHQQAKRIFWRDIKALLPFWIIQEGWKGISESELSIRLITGAVIIVVGLDKPERIEGIPIDWICIDEYGNVKKSAWDEHVRPALSERGGEAWLIGVPEGRNHYYDMAVMAQEEQKNHPEQWGYFHWLSADIIAPEEIAAAKAELDELTFRQEFEADFISFQGRIYYPFDRMVHAAEPLRYDPELPLFLCFDFNISPGICAICQEKVYLGLNQRVAPTITACIDEVWIARNSNTKKICQQIVERYRGHKAGVYLHGDATGGARGTAKVEGSDWDLVKACLEPVFGNRLRFCVPAANPKERVRINAMNSRLESTDGKVHFLTDPIKCPRTIIDFEGVTCKDDNSGEIDKSADSTLTHLTDAIGYYIAEAHPLTKHLLTIEQI